MTFDFRSGCQSSNGAGIQSAHGVRGCEGGVFFNNLMRLKVTPDDTAKDPYFIEYRGLSAFVDKDLFYLTVRSHDPDFPGLPAFLRGVADDVRFFKDHLYVVDDVVSYPFDVTNPNPGNPYNAVLGFFDDDLNIWRSIIDVLIVTVGTGSDLAFCEIEDCLTLILSGFVPSENENPDTSGIGKINGHDEDYASMGSFTSFPPTPDFQTIGGLVQEYKDTVVMEGLIGADLTSRILRYLGDGIWEFLDLASSDTDISPRMIQQKMSIKHLNDGASLEYLFLGGHDHLWCYSDEFKFQKVLNLEQPTGGGDGFFQLSTYAGGITFQAIGTIEGQDEITRPILWFGDNEEFIAIGAGDAEFVVTVTPDNIIEAHGELYGSGTRPIPDNEYIPFFIYQRGTNTWEQLEFNLPVVEDAVVTIDSHAVGQLFEMDENFTPTNPELGGADWEVADIPLPALPL